jgi:hypothetical protein
MTAPHAVLKKFPPPGKPKSPGLAPRTRSLEEAFIALTGVQS